MKKLLLPIILLIVFTGCRNASNQETKANEIAMQTNPSTEILQKGCYAFQGTKDTIIFQITGIDKGIKGELTIAINEKDRNSGTFDGKLEGSHLFGTYTFMSEGIESKRELAFLVQGEQLIEGYGELNPEGNAFKDKSEIKYTSIMPLSKTDCQTLN